jgi:predicted Zn-dependent protease
LPLALAIIQPIVERWPNEPAFRDTRGHILARSGKYQEALVDLLVALPGRENRPEIHARLAECYSRLGMEESAAAHRARATAGQAK